jgi:hypothetical protein
VNAAWEAARKVLYPLPAGIKSGKIPLEWLHGETQPCVACDDPAMTGYIHAGQLRPLHAICAMELGLYAAMVRERRIAPPPELRGLLSGL